MNVLIECSYGQFKDRIKERKAEVIKSKMQLPERSTSNVLTNGSLSAVTRLPIKLREERNQLIGLLEIRTGGDTDRATELYETRISFNSWCCWWINCKKRQNTVYIISKYWDPISIRNASSRSTEMAQIV